ncbi:Ig-like domain-containing protein [Aeromicrobium sp. UC242_57]|uniref:Ig-like domain-containing protein n=1 Tax=Aeromicrobium sp. UC242_57 TaxID=3374624 RepID=UPI00378E6615
MFLRLGKATQVFADALDSTTSLALPSPNAVFGQKPTATVSVTGGTGVAPSGTVTITDGSTVLGSGRVEAGTARITLTGLKIGSRRLVASYSGDARTTPGASAAVSLKVAKGKTGTSSRSARSRPRRVRAALPRSP